MPKASKVKKKVSKVKSVSKAKPKSLSKPKDINKGPIKISKNYIFPRIVVKTSQTIFSFKFGGQNALETVFFFCFSLYLATQTV